MDLRLRLVVISLMVCFTTQIRAVPVFPFDLFSSNGNPTEEIDQSTYRPDIATALSMFFDDVKEALGSNLPFGNLANLLRKSTIELSKIKAIINPRKPIPNGDDQDEDERSDQLASAEPLGEHRDEPSKVDDSSVTTMAEAQFNEDVDENSEVSTERDFEGSLAADSSDNFDNDEDKSENNKNKQLVSEKLSKMEENPTTEGKLKERIEGNTEGNSFGSIQSGKVDNNSNNDGSVLSKEELCKLYSSNDLQSTQLDGYEDFDYVYDCEYDYDATPVAYYDNYDDIDLATAAPVLTTTTEKDDYPDYQIYTDLEDFSEDYTTEDEYEILEDDDDNGDYQNYEDYGDYYDYYEDYDEYDDDEKNYFLLWISGHSRNEQNDKNANDDNADFDYSDQIYGSLLSRGDGDNDDNDNNDKEPKPSLNGSNKTPLADYSGETNYPSNYTLYSEASPARANALTNTFGNEPHKEIRISTSY